MVSSERIPEILFHRYLCSFAVAAILLLAFTYSIPLYAVSDFSDIRKLEYDCNSDAARIFAEEWLYCYSIYGQTWSTHAGHRLSAPRSYNRLKSAEIVFEIGWPIRWAESRYDAISPDSHGTIQIRPVYMGHPDKYAMASNIRFFPIQSGVLLLLLTFSVRFFFVVISKHFGLKLKNNIAL